MKIINLTMHNLTQQQIQELRRMHQKAEIDIEPKGKAFLNLDDRIDYVLQVINSMNDGDGIIIGGDTLFFILLTEEIIRREKNIMLLHANTERIRDHNDRFVFNFKNWITYIIEGGK